MKKIFVLTGEASGDKLATTVIEKIQKQNNNVKFLSVGGSNLTSLGINSIFNIEQITYMGFTSVLLNIFKIFYSSLSPYPYLRCNIMNSFNIRINFFYYFGNA